MLIDDAKIRISCFFFDENSMDFFGAQSVNEYHIIQVIVSKLAASRKPYYFWLKLVVTAEAQRRHNDAIRKTSIFYYRWITKPVWRDISRFFHEFEVFLKFIVDGVNIWHLISGESSRYDEINRIKYVLRCSMHSI
jgi:hypothetical protein